MKKIWIVSLLLLGCFAARAQAPAPLKGRIAVSVPRVDMRLSYAEYDKAFSGDLRTAQTDLEGRYMLPDDDKIYAVTLHRRDDAAGAPALASFFILPGEQLEVLGLFQDGDTFDWRVKGSPSSKPTTNTAGSIAARSFAPRRCAARTSRASGTTCRRSGSGSSTPSCVCSTAASRSAVAPTSARTPRRRCRPTTSPASPSRSKRWWSTIRCSPSRCAKGAMRRFSTSSARCTSGFSTPDAILK